MSDPTIDTIGYATIHDILQKEKEKDVKAPNGKMFRIRSIDQGTLAEADRYAIKKGSKVYTTFIVIWKGVVKPIISPQDAERIDNETSRFLIDEIMELSGMSVDGIQTTEDDISNL